MRRGPSAAAVERAAGRRQLRVGDAVELQLSVAKGWSARAGGLYRGGQHAAAALQQTLILCGVKVRLGPESARHPRRVAHPPHVPSLLLRPLALEEQRVRPARRGLGAQKPRDTLS